MPDQSRHRREDEVGEATEARDRVDRSAAEVGDVGDGAHDEVISLA